MGCSEKIANSPNDIEEKIIFERTVDELILEFTIDWVEANKFYSGKSIKIHGEILYAIHAIDQKPPTALGVAVVALGNNTSSWMDDDILVDCYFNALNVNELKDGDKMEIQGEFANFHNGQSFKSINLKNCIIIRVIPVVSTTSKTAEN
jgi:hypothetical protein